MSWFLNKKKITNDDILKMKTDEAKRIASTSDEDLLREFRKELLEYEKEIDAEWSFAIAEYEDASSIASIRDAIHDLFEELTRRDLDVDTKWLSDLDRRWQDYCLEQAKIYFAGKKRFSQPAEQKSHWWWWFDRLDELSDKERATI